MDHLLEKLRTVSTRPGVYLMKDENGAIIYVGKAKNLKKRLAAYFKSADRMDLKTGVLVRKIAAFETILTETEKEALILESTLIKRHRPRYNVILKDDKRYPSLRIDIKGSFPRLEIVRKPRKDGALYFGPFTSAGAVHQTLKFINKTFKLRKCKDSVFRNRTRPCLNHQIGGCLGPCCLPVSPADYQDIVQEVVWFLRGRTAELLGKIKTEMSVAAENQAFEKAAELRDKLFAIQKTTEQQVAVTTDFKDRDIIGLARSDGVAQITLMPVRNGFLVGSRSYHFSDVLAPDDEMAEAFVRQYYEKTGSIPDEILLPTAIESASLLASWLRERKGRKVALLAPRRGEKARLIKMACRNASDGLAEYIRNQTSQADLLERLQHRLKLTRTPVRIECFDNSNLSGDALVAGMVVFENGRPDKKAYRTFKIRTVTLPDDYAAMAEALARRLKRGKETGALPDLLMVDGGKGQLNVAVAVTKDLGLAGAFDIVGIAKKDEKAGETEDKIYRPGRANPVLLKGDRDLLYLLQRIRDEAHRFAIGFHRRKRRKQSLGSALDAVPGIGPNRKKALLDHLGGIQKVRAATAEELAAVPGISKRLAAEIRAALSSE